MFGQLSDEQIVQAASAIYTAAGGGAAGLQAVQDKTAQYGLTMAEVQSAFVATGQGNLYLQIVNQSRQPSPWEIQVGDSLYQYYMSAGGGAPGVLAALNAMVQTGMVGPEWANQIRNSADTFRPQISDTQRTWVLSAVQEFVRTYEVAGRGAAGIVAVFALDQSNPNYRAFTDITHTLTVLLAVAQPPVSYPATVSRQTSALTTASTTNPLVTSAIALYSSGGAAAVVREMFAHGITVEQLSAAFAAAGVSPDAGAVTEVVATYRAIEAQSLALSALPNIQSVQLDIPAGNFVVTTTRGRFTVRADGVSTLPAEATGGAATTAVYQAPPPGTSVAAIVRDAMQVYNQAGGGDAGWSAIGRAGAEAVPYVGPDTIVAALRQSAAWPQVVAEARRYPATGLAQMVLAAAGPVPAPAPPPAPVPPPVPAPLSANQIADAAVRIYNRDGGGSAGYQAILTAQQRPDSGVSWGQLDVAMRTAYGGSLAALWTSMLRGVFPAVVPAPALTRQGLPPPPPPPPPVPVTEHPGTSPSGPVPRPTLSPAQIIQASNTVFSNFADPVAGMNAVRAQAEANHVPWAEVVAAFRSVGGATWDAFVAAGGAAEDFSRASLLGNFNPWVLGGGVVLGLLALSGGKSRHATRRR